MKSPKILKIEWRHPSAASSGIPKILKALRLQLKKKNVDVIFVEKKSKTSEILFNDMPMEFLLDEARIKENFCGISRTPAERKKISRNIPEELIKKAALKAVGLKT